LPVSELNESQKAEVARHGLNLADAERQLELYADPPPYAQLIRPCTAGDGIVRFDDAGANEAAENFEPAAAGKRLCVFVPASGAASRMFKVPLSFLHADAPCTRGGLEAAAASGDAAAAEMLEILDGFSRFAFRDTWAAKAEAAGLNVQPGADEDLRPLLSVWLEDDGMGYASLPKGLLAFHSYEDGARTAFEEHLVEASRYACAGDGKCRLHFTVSPEHEEKFKELLDAVGPSFEQRLGVRFEIGFSVQKPSTDAMAVDMDNAPFRNADGSLLFRPGGHGALIENLNDLDADVVFVKNIDNIVPDHLREPCVFWKRVVGSTLMDLQSEGFRHLDALDNDGDAAFEAAAAFLRERLNVSVANAAEAAAALDRPYRVCGMVENTGEPGGGPFWTLLDGSETAQVVETSQVDPDSESQKAILAKATHFNPVDLACAIRDREGKPYDLRRFVDENAVFIAEKSKDGKPLKSLERPGLWNGAMARWNTVFVEVPIETFNPVKTVNVLLEPAHSEPRASERRDPPTRSR
jgi:hypothetical protein